LDGDGAVELVGTPERNLFFDFLFGPTYHGLGLWRVDASGGVERHTLLGPQVLVRNPYEYNGQVIASDLTGDGLLDLAVVDANATTGPALVVLVGQRDGVPVVEGRYRLPGIGYEVLAGDVNGDEATDLVVLGRSVEGGGGAFVFLNQGAPATAIAAEMTTTPTAFALGANYPNPFNPATTIPVSVAASTGDVDLTIYNVLGQPVRRVWAGPLAAGDHRLAWDGRDAQSQPVAAGVYVVRLHQGNQTRIRKMVKIE
ncbi:MAG: T9SS type A sorting domain-containing protein, partial [Gemmatimonadota bacterium]|nr:T9SS type A sorting domain-containing protein [Gemmatimonadota bacterium]